MIDPDVESRPWEEQRRLDDVAYRAQLTYLFDRSAFYRDKLRAAGFPSAESAGGIDDITGLPFTEKDELRRSRDADHPIGTHLAVPMTEVVRVFSTSGTTGTPSYIPLTAGDLENWVRISSRSYAASGLRPGDGIVTTYNAGPFAAGATLDAFNRLGLCHIPIGAGNTERLMTAIRLLSPTILAATPSYALHLSEWAGERGIDLPGCSIRRILVAGEPGGGEPALRARLETAWGAKVTEAMGIGDISVSLWGECEGQRGMHFSGRDLVHFELVDPDSGQPVPLEDGARGELVLTHLKQRAVPLLRFRTRDHVELRTGPCGCGRTAPRVRCIGRTDDMLIVRGVNLFPSAVREVVATFLPAVSGVIAIRPLRRGVKQTPPLPVVVELAPGTPATDRLAEAIARRLREVLVVSTAVELVAPGTLPRTDYKSKLVDFSRATD